MTSTPATASSVLDYGFDTLEPKHGFIADDAVEAEIRRRFGATRSAAAVRERWHWRDTVKGRLAEIIVLDRFSRNIHRGESRSFACDPLALALAWTRVTAGDDGTHPRPAPVRLYALHAQRIAGDP